MKRLLAFVVAIVGLGMMLSGCVVGTTRVKDAYIEKNYIDKVKVPESKKVGDRNIKFYVGKVIDKRKDKAVYVKRGGFWIRLGSTVFANTQKTIRNITKKALYNTGWGVVDNESKADFVIDTVLKDFSNHMGIPSKFVVKSNIYVLNKNKERIIDKHIYEKKDGIYFHPDLTAEFKFIVGDISRIYYKTLINYFSSPEFVKAIEKAYREENDDSTISH